MPTKFQKLKYKCTISGIGEAGDALISRNTLYVIPNRIKEASNTAALGVVGMAMNAGNALNRSNHELYVELDVLKIVNAPDWPTVTSGAAFVIPKRDVDGWELVKKVGTWYLLIDARGEQIKFVLGMRKASKDKVAGILRQYGWNEVKNGGGGQRSRRDDDYDDDEEDSWEEGERRPRRRRQAQSEGGSRERSGRSRSRDAERRQSRVARVRQRVILVYLLPTVVALLAGVLVAFIRIRNNDRAARNEPEPREKEVVAADDRTAPRSRTQQLVQPNQTPIASTDTQQPQQPSQPVPGQLPAQQPQTRPGQQPGTVLPGAQPVASGPVTSKSGRLKLIQDTGAVRRRIQKLALSVEGSRLAGSVDREIGIWDDLTAEPLVRWPMTLQLQQLEFSPDGKLIAVSDLKKFAVHDVETGSVVWESESMSSQPEVTWSPDSSRLVGRQVMGFGAWSRDGTKLWQDRTLRGDAVDFAADGSSLLLGGFRDLLIVNPETGRLEAKLELARELPTLTSARVSVAEQIVVVPGYDGAKIIDCAVRPPRLRDFTGPAGSSVQEHLRLSRNGRVAVGVKSREATVWDTRTGEKLDTLSLDSGIVSEAEISADGRRVAIVTTNSRTQIWELTIEADE